MKRFHSRAMKQCPILLHGLFFISNAPSTLNADTRVTDVAKQTRKGGRFSAKLLQRMTNGECPATKPGRLVTNADSSGDGCECLPEAAGTLTVAAAD